MIAVFSVGDLDIASKDSIPRQSERVTADATKPNRVPDTQNWVARVAVVWG